MKSRSDMSFLVASRGSGSVSSSAAFSGSGGAGSMAMSISGSSSLSSMTGGCWVLGRSGAAVGLGLGVGDAIVGEDAGEFCGRMEVQLLLR